MQREKAIYLGLILVIAYLVLIDKNVLYKSESLTKTFNLSELRLTRIDVPCEVYLTSGENKKMVIEAPENVIDRITSISNNGVLTISAATERKVFGFFKVKDQMENKIKIFVNHDQLDRIIVNENATIISVDYKPISFRASSEATSEEDTKVTFTMANIHLSKLGLIDILPLLVSDIKKLVL